MYSVIYSTGHNDPKGKDIRAIRLRRIAEEKGWYPKRTFSEKTDMGFESVNRSEFDALMKYTDKTRVDIVMVDEISSLGNCVEDIKSKIELFRGKGIAIYIRQFNLLTLEDGKESKLFSIMMKVLACGMELERNNRRLKHREGIRRAQTRGAFKGRKPGTITSPGKLLNKYSRVAELIDQREFSVREVARISGHSINTVRKVKELKNRIK